MTAEESTRLLNNLFHKSVLHDCVRVRGLHLVSGESGSWGRRSRFFVSAGVGLDLRKLSTKVRRTVARARFAPQFFKKLRLRGTLEDEVGKKCTGKELARRQVRAQVAR